MHVSCTLYVIALISAAQNLYISRSACAHSLGWHLQFRSSTLSWVASVIPLKSSKFPEIPQTKASPSFLPQRHTRVRSATPKFLVWLLTQPLLSRLLWHASATAIYAHVRSSTLPRHPLHIPLPSVHNSSGHAAISASSSAAPPLRQLRQAGSAVTRRVQSRAGVRTLREGRLAPPSPTFRHFSRCGANLQAHCMTMVSSQPITRVVHLCGNQG